MAEIEITIRAEEEDLRRVVEVSARNIGGFALPAANRVALAIAAALPKPRIQVKPGMVVRLKHNGARSAIRGKSTADMRRYPMDEHGSAAIPKDGLDPDGWEVILDVD